MAKSETIDQKIARLRGELEAAEREKLNHVIDERIADFAGLPDDLPADIATAAASIITDAWANFVAYAEAQGVKLSAKATAPDPRALGSLPPVRVTAKAEVGPAAPPALPVPDPAAPIELDDDEDEEPMAELDTFGPADDDGRQECLICKGEGLDKRPGPGAGNCCLNCDGEGYRWVEVPLPAGCQPPTPAPVREADRPAMMPIPPEPIAPSNPLFVHPGSGWGPVDSNGLTKHLLCKGKGRIETSGMEKGTSCQACNGQGMKRAIRRSAA